MPINKLNLPLCTQTLDTVRCTQSNAVLLVSNSSAMDNLPIEEDFIRLLDSLSLQY